MSSMKKKYNEEELNEKRKRESIENAKEVASKSHEIINSGYEKFMQRIAKIVRRINSRVDFLIFNSLSAKIISLVLAIFLYLAVVNSNDINVSQQVNVGKNVYGVKVVALYDKNKYQVENLPETVDLSLIGTLDQIRKTEASNKLEVIADLSNYKPGLKQKVDLLYSGVANNVDVKFSQPTYEVNIYAKQVKEFKLTPQLVKSSKDYSYQIHLSKDTIKLSAAQHTLDNIANVYVLVDVEGRVKSYVEDASIIAFTNDGKLINNLASADEDIKVEVSILPNK